MNIIISSKAQSNLDEIVRYHREKGHSKIGKKIRSRIIQKMLRLRDFPEIGQVEEILQDLNLGHRYLVEGNNKIIYRVINDDVLITHIFDTRQDPEKM